MIESVSRLTASRNSRTVDWRIYTRYIDGGIRVNDAHCYLSQLCDDSVGAIVLDPPSRFGIGSSNDSERAIFYECIDALLPIAIECRRVLRPGGITIMLGSSLVVSAWEMVVAMTDLQRQGEIVVLWRRQKRDRRHAAHELPSLGSSARWHAKPGRWLAPVQPLHANSNVLVAEEVPEKDRHDPVQRPVALFTYLISTLTARGDLIVDPMCGTGSALVGARVAERYCIGCDHSREMVKTATERVGIGFLHEHFEDQQKLYWWVDGREVEIKS